MNLAQHKIVNLLKTFFLLISFISVCVFIYLLKDFIYLLLERGEERKKERNICVEMIHGLLSLVYPKLGTWPATQACALTGN